MGKPVVNADACTGCGLCADIAPGAFEVNDDGIAVVLDPITDDEDTVQEAADSCPVEAISIEG